MAKHGKLTYFVPVRSRGEPVQMCIAYGKVDMDVELISFDEWDARKAAKVAPFLPYITQNDGTIMLETLVIMKHIATLGAPKFVIDAKQDELCKIANDSAIQEADPTFNLPPSHRPRHKAGEPAYDDWFNAVGEVLKDYVVRLGDGPFFAGESPGYAECFVWHNLDNCFSIDKAAFTEYVGAEGMGKLTAFYERFALLDGIKEYLARRPTVWGFPGSRAQPTAPYPGTFKGSFGVSPFKSKEAYDEWVTAGADPAALPA